MNEDQNLPKGWKQITESGYERQLDGGFIELYVSRHNETWYCWLMANESRQLPETCTTLKEAIEYTEYQAQLTIKGMLSALEYEAAINHEWE